MKKMNLTAKRVQRCLRKPGRYRDDDVRGLLLVVTNPNNASWQLRYEKNGRERWLGLGPVREFSLKEARERARAARQQLRDGIDPIDAKRQAKTEAALSAAKTLTFAEAATEYFNQHASKWKNAKHRKQFLSTLRAYALPVIGSLPVGAIDTGLVLKVIEPHWQKKTETMSRVRRRIEAVLDWATVRNYRTGENPARWGGHLGEVLPARQGIAKTQHHPALPYPEVPTFLATLRGHEGVAARALEFTILTAARTGEIIGAKWDEIDFKTATWTVPATRMKAGKEHRVPLSDAAVALLKTAYAEEGNPFVFIGGQAGSCLSNTAMAALLRRIRAGITVHGFRSAFRDWAAERTNFANPVVEMALAHSVGDKVEAAYRRGDLFDKRRRLMVEWAKYCASVPVKVGGDVIPLAGRAAS
jgi:integrase